MSRHTFRTTVAAVAVTVMAVLAAPARAEEPTEHELPSDVTAQSLYASPGPHEVRTAVRTGSCQGSLYGMIAHITVTIFGNADELRCTAAFPGGLDSPIGANTYFPADIAELPTAPLVVFTGGILSLPGNYDGYARLLASQGFVVVVPFDFVNSTVDVPSLGAAVAILSDRDPASPLFGKVDLGRTFFAGHSAGGAASLQAATVWPALAALIDPSLRIAGVLAIAPGPLAAGALITVPSLYLTGYNDFVVPDFAWVRWWQYNATTQAPSWIANARGVTHFSPVDSPANYRSAGTGVAWLRYLAFGDPTAKQFFVGPNWRTPLDTTYFSAERNAQAAALR
ncbi:alpha/beta hydrolase [Nocardia sp. AG03]|uniref:poly(ethylene terephthalate) hydrolase family protein n=1 Tax=Nocardia sp. AG03 TaxID=3025312 RepID=UPI0024188E2B|nr:alpha/beta hydrolase [Nocardia sp. AG03]